MDRVSLTKREEELMSFLWDFGEPLTVRAMLDFCPKRTWSDNYLNVMIRSLEKKGAIEACDMMRYSRQYARAFRPVLGREEYYIYMAQLHGGQPRGGRSPSCAGGGGVCPERKAGEYGPIAPRVGESPGGIQEKWMRKRAAAVLRQPFRFSVVGKIGDFPTMQERINVLRNAQVGRFWGPVWRKCF